MEENNGNSKLKKILFNEVSLIFGVVAVVLSIFIYLTNPQATNDTSIQLLQAQVETQKTTIDTLTKTQQNDFHTLETKLETLNNSIAELAKQQSEVNALLKYHMNIK